eukprot:5309108-Pyramimonas_sp.AAC.1
MTSQVTSWTTAVRPQRRTIGVDGTVSAPSHVPAPTGVIMLFKSAVEKSSRSIETCIEVLYGPRDRLRCNGYACSAGLYREPTCQGPFV